MKDVGKAAEKLLVKARADLRIQQCMGNGSQVYCGKNKKGYLGQWGYYINYNESESYKSRRHTQMIGFC